MQPILATSSVICLVSKKLPLPLASHPPLRVYDSIVDKVADGCEALHCVFLIVGILSSVKNDPFWDSMYRWKAGESAADLGLILYYAGSIVAFDKYLLSIAGYGKVKTAWVLL